MLPTDQPSIFQLLALTFKGIAEHITKKKGYHHGYRRQQPVGKVQRKISVTISNHFENQSKNMLHTLSLSFVNGIILRKYFVIAPPIK